MFKGLKITRVASGSGIRVKKRFVFVPIIFLMLLLPSNISASAVTASPPTAQDKLDGYDRSLFKHWIDANKNGCDTRAEVLIAEAVVKPKVGKKCKLTGGKWLSAYDGKTLTDASKLDVDHLVPLAEAWRSGAWAWTSKQRQDYANDLSDSRALIAVTLTSNRSKSDKDISEWVPKLDTCTYIKNWVAIKVRYSLTYDDKESAALASYSQTCPIGELKVEILADYQYQSAPAIPAPVASVTPTPTPPLTPTPTPTITSTPKATASPSSSTSPVITPTPTPTPEVSVTPSQTKVPAVKYKNCTEAKAAGVTPLRKSTNPELYEMNSGLDRDKDGVACE
jgi:hypothetical protein